MPRTSCGYFNGPNVKRKGHAVIDSLNYVDIEHACGHKGKVHKDAVELLKDSACRDCLAAYYDKELPF